MEPLRTARSERDSYRTRCPAPVISFFLLGLIIRLGIAIGLPGLAGDTAQYEQIGWNIVHNFAYSTSPEAPLQPSLTRSPGYPLFLAVIFAIAGRNPLAVRVAQAILDMLTVLVTYLIARKVSGERTTVLTACLAAIVPFTAIYVGYLLSEVLATFMTAVTLLVTICAIQQPRALTFLLIGTCLGSLVLIRPDFVLLPAAVIVCLALLHLLRKWHLLLAMTLIGVGTLAPLAPWVVRNAVVFGNFTPLSEVGSVEGQQPFGFLAWIRTWHSDLSERDRGVWPYWTHRWHDFDFPNSAFDSDDERVRVSTLLQRAAAASTPGERRAIEDDFTALAHERARRHPVRTWLVLPARRAIRLWLNSRTEAFPLPAFAAQESIFSGSMAIKFLLTAINLALIPLAFVGFVALRRDPAILGVLGGIILYRTIFHAYWAGMEARYVLEAFPAVYVLAAEGIAFALALRRQGPTSISPA